MEKIKFDERGLICAIAQDAASGDVLMQAYMNEQALNLTLNTGYAHYYSRSRNALWKKGKQAGTCKRCARLRLTAIGIAYFYKSNRRARRAIRAAVPASFKRSWKKRVRACASLPSCNG